MLRYPRATIVRIPPVSCPKLFYIVLSRSRGTRRAPLPPFAQPQGESAVLRLHPRCVRIQTAVAKPALLRLGLQVRAVRFTQGGRANDTTAVIASVEFMRTRGDLGWVVNHLASTILPVVKAAREMISFKPCIYYYGGL